MAGQLIPIFQRAVELAQRGTAAARPAADFLVRRLGPMAREQHPFVNLNASPDTPIEGPTGQLLPQPPTEQPGYMDPQISAYLEFNRRRQNDIAMQKTQEATEHAEMRQRFGEGTVGVAPDPWAQSIPPDAPGPVTEAPAVPMEAEPTVQRTAENVHPVPNARTDANYQMVTVTSPDGSPSTPEGKEFMVRRNRQEAEKRELADKQFVRDNPHIYEKPKLQPFFSSPQERVRAMTEWQKSRAGPQEVTPELSSELWATKDLTHAGFTLTPVQDFMEGMGYPTQMLRREGTMQNLGRLTHHPVTGHAELNLIGMAKEGQPLRAQDTVTIPFPSRQSAMEFMQFVLPSMKPGQMPSKEQLGALRGRMMEILGADEDMASKWVFEED